MRAKVLVGVRALLLTINTLAAIGLIASVGLNFANVIGRYFFSASIPWAEEAMLFLMVGCVFLGNGVVAWSGRHIRMDVVLRVLPQRVRAALDLFADLLFMATMAAVVYFAAPVIRDLAAFDQRSQAAEFPLVIPQSLVPIGFAIMGLLVAVRLLIAGRAPAPQRDH